MNSQEHALLEGFLDKLVQVHGTRKIPQADAMIRRAVDRQPDAAYLLVQRSLMLEQALEQSNARIAELELAQRQPDRNFLDTGTSNNPPQMQRTAAMIASPPAGAAAPPEPSRGAVPQFPRTGGGDGRWRRWRCILIRRHRKLVRPPRRSLPGQAAQSFIPEDVTINNYSRATGSTLTRATNPIDSPTMMMRRRVTPIQAMMTGILSNARLRTSLTVDGLFLANDNPNERIELGVHSLCRLRWLWCSAHIASSGAATSPSYGRRSRFPTYASGFYPDRF